MAVHRYGINSQELEPSDSISYFGPSADLSPDPEDKEHSPTTSSSLPSATEPNQLVYIKDYQDDAARQDLVVLSEQILGVLPTLISCNTDEGTN
jgi:hypothetical protein